MRARRVWVEGAQGAGPGKASGALKFLRKSSGMERRREEAKAHWDRKTI